MNRQLRLAPPPLQALIAANGRLWAAEAEVFTAYFASAKRSAETDEAWLIRQCYKELVDGVVGQLARVTRAVDDIGAARASAADAVMDEGVQVELSHYIAFATAHRQALALIPISARPVRARELGSDWAENVALQTLRAEHRRLHGEIGARAAAFTEGGYCTLYSAGMARRGGTVLDDAIAAACARVFDDEWDHMLAGIAGFADQTVSAADWAVFEQMTLAQGRARIHMRNAQFGYPLDAARIQVIEAGALPPLPFDYTRAGLRIA